MSGLMVGQKEFGVGAGVHKGSVLRSLLFILLLEALSREFHTGVPRALSLHWWPGGVYLQTQGVEGWHGK